VSVTWWWHRCVQGQTWCVVFGVFPKRPAFASSVFFILAVLFLPTGGGGGDADRCRLPVL
jgi:hypothetical protein